MSDDFAKLVILNILNPLSSVIFVILNNKNCVASLLFVKRKYPLITESTACIESNIEVIRLPLSSNFEIYNSVALF